MPLLPKRAAATKEVAQPATGTIIETRGLRKQYGRLWAVEDFSLTLAPGAIFGLIGANGAGKTTALKMLATLLSPTDGEGWVAGYSITRQPDRVRQMLGYVPDEFGIYDDMRVGEYLDFFAACYNVPRKQRRALVGELLELVDLAERHESSVSTLSRGMRQRLCLAHALVHDPKVLILDEPASGLDPQARTEFKELLRELAAMGKTIIMSSHLLPDLEDLCTDIGVMAKGVLTQYGAPDTLGRHYAQHRRLTVQVLRRASRAEYIIRARPSVSDVLVYPVGSSLATFDVPHGGLITESARADAARFEIEFTGNDSESADLLRALTLAGVEVAHFAQAGGQLSALYNAHTSRVLP